MLFPLRMQVVPPLSERNASVDLLRHSAAMRLWAKEGTEVTAEKSAARSCRLFSSLSDHDFQQTGRFCGHPALGGIIKDCDFQWFLLRACTSVTRVGGGWVRRATSGVAGTIFEAPTSSFLQFYISTSRESEGYEGRAESVIRFADANSARGSGLNATAGAVMRCCSRLRIKSFLPDRARKI